MGTRTKYFIVAGALFSVLSFSASSSLGKGKIKTITIGIASNFTDVTPNSYNPFGNSVKNGVVMAADEVNGKLKAKGLQIELKEFNYGSDLLNVRKIVREGAKSDLIGMIGYEFSDHALLSAPLHQELKFPMITPSASADRISKIGDYVFQGTFNNSYQVEILAKYAVKNLGAKKAAIITASDCAYCEDVATSIKKSYESNGGKIVYDISILSDQKDFQKALKTYDFEKVDSIIVPNQEMTSARVITYLLKQGVKKIFLGGDGWRTLGNIHKTTYGKEFRGYMMAHWAPNQKTKKSQEFVKAYRSRFKMEPTDSAVLGYDAMLMAGKAILSIQNGAYTRESFKEGLEKLKTLSGVTGTFIFRKNQAPAKSILLMKSSPHGFVIDKILEPDSEVIYED